MSVVDRGGKIPLVVGVGGFSCSFLASTPQLGWGRAGWVVGMASYDVVPKVRGGFQMWLGCPLASS